MVIDTGGTHEVPINTYPPVSHGKAFFSCGSNYVARLSDARVTTNMASKDRS